MLLKSPHASVALQQSHVGGVDTVAREPFSFFMRPRVNLSDTKTKTSARSVCLGISEMRRAIIDYIDDDEDLQDLAKVSHAWYQDIANGPTYRNVLRRLLFKPGSRDTLPELPNCYSYLGVVLLLRQVQQDPQALQAPHDDMIWLRGFLAEHYPLMLGYFNRYSVFMQTALWQQRRDFITTTAAQGLTGLAYGMQLAIVAGAVALSWREPGEGNEPILKFAPLIIAPATLYAAHLAVSDLWALMPEKSELPLSFDTQKKALQYALRPRSLSGLPAPEWEERQR